MIDLVWNFPLLREQRDTWAEALGAAMQAYGREPVEALRPSFRTVERSMRERAARWLGFDVERVWMTGGGHHGNLNALLASGLAGTRFAVEGDTYPGFLDQCRLTKTAVVACAVDEDGLVPESLREVCARGVAAGEPVRGLFTMPTVQNPLGFVTPRKRREEIVEIAREFGLTLIEDDAYGYMEEDAPPNYAVLAPERTFYVRGLAKSLAPGARTGFLVGPVDAAEALVMSLKCTATGTGVPQNMAALAMCEDGRLERLMADKRVEGAVRNAAAREVLEEACGPDAVAAGARCAWHVWARLREGVEGEAVVRACAEAGVMVSDGKWCAAGAGYGRGLRLALGGEVDRERCLEGVRGVAEVLRGM